MMKFSHLKLAHSYWNKFLKPGDTAIDATCGNGKDSLILAKKILAPQKGRLICLDIQKISLQKTQERLQKELEPECLNRVELYHQSHENFPLLTEKPKGIIYNLGYLPGGDKSITTKARSTLASLNTALSLLAPQGFLSITCYPGHPEGRIEEKEIFDWIFQLNIYLYEIRFYKKINYLLSPSLIIIRVN